MRRNVILMIVGVIIIGTCDAANLSRILRTKRAESDFILRSCIATAQLTRKHRTNDAPQVTAENSNQLKIVPASQILDHSKFKHYDINKHIRNNPRIHIRSKGRHLSDKSMTDTPLGTVDVKAIRKDIPKVFRKKDPLPELDRNGSARNLDTDAPIIVVKTLNH